jgi:hypothetical protein
VSRPHPDPRRLVRLWLAGAVALCFFPLAPRLTQPIAVQLLLPVTPIDRIDADRARQWLFLESCRPFLSAGSPFTVLADDRDVEMALYMMAIGVFPANRPLPHSYYGVPTLPEARRARYVLEYRLSVPADPGARLVARVPNGAVYERTPEP